MPLDLTHLLHETAERPSQPLDVADVRGRARRRRLRRRGAEAVAGVAVLAFAAVLLTGLTEPDGELELIDDPPPPPVEESDSDDAEQAREADDTAEPDEDGEFGPELLAHDLRGLPPEGIAVSVDKRVVLLSLDRPAEVLGHVRGELDPSPEGLSSPASGPLPLSLLAHSSTLWVDPASGRTWDQHSAGIPVGASARVLLDGEATPGERRVLLRDRGGLQEEPEVVAAWPEDAPWWLTPDHRVVSWATCADGDCPHHFYDSATGERGELDPGCWVAAAAEDTRTRVCGVVPGSTTALGGREIRVEGESALALEVPSGRDDEPTAATAVFGQDVVRVDHETCDRVEPLRIQEGELGLVQEGLRHEMPSAVPLGVSADGKIVLHRNAACAPQADQPGISIHDPATGVSEPIWDVELPPDAVRMWSSPGSRAADSSQSAEDAERDGVVAALAALPLHLRVEPTARSESPEGWWVGNRIPLTAAHRAEGCVGDRSGVPGLDFSCIGDGELLLLDETGERIERAYPLPEIAPRWIEVTDDAVYCGAQADGGQAHSMLCRVDRETGELTVRVFPSSQEHSQEYRARMAGFLEASGWEVDDSRPGVRFTQSALRDHGVIHGSDGEALVDPETLELTLDP